MTETTFPKSIWAYVDISKQVEDANHLQLFAAKPPPQAGFGKMILNVLP